MHYSQFCSIISEVLRKKTGQDTQFIRKTLRKNNGVCPDVLFILPPGSALGPVIYLEPLYDQYQKGISMETICASVLSFLECRPPFPSSICQEILNPEFAKSRIAFRLISQERNGELLEHIPWFPFHDLAMVFFICLDPDSTDLVSALVHWPLLSAWDMDADTLRSLAEENTPLLFPPVLTPLTELLLPSVYEGSPFPDLTETEGDLETAGPAAAGIRRDAEPPAAAEGLGTTKPAAAAKTQRDTEPMAAAEGLGTAEHVAAAEILGDTEPMAAAEGLETAEPAATAEIPENGPALHVLTNRRGIYGASCMLYRDIIKDFADQEEADVIILPSSIHEVLLFPDHLMFDHAFLCRTVQEINREDVPEEDVLSDRIYIFSRETGTIIPSPLSSCHKPEPAGTGSPW